MKQAADLFRAFTGCEATSYDEAELPHIEVVVGIGEVVGIAYKAERDGVVEEFFHRFRARSRPRFCVGHDGLSIVIVGGSFEFTERGIVDK